MRRSSSLSRLAASSCASMSSSSIAMACDERSVPEQGGKRRVAKGWCERRDENLSVGGTHSCTPRSRMDAPARAASVEARRSRTSEPSRRRPPPRAKRHKTDAKTPRSFRSASAKRLFVLLLRKSFNVDPARHLHNPKRCVPFGVRRRRRGATRARREDGGSRRCETHRRSPLRCHLLLPSAVATLLGWSSKVDYGYESLCLLFFLPDKIGSERWFQAFKRPGRRLVGLVYLLGVLVAS